jgi:hypothetical protein
MERKLIDQERKQRKEVISNTNNFLSKTTLETSGEDVKTTLETSGEDVKLHSKLVEKIYNYTRNGCGRCETTLETSGELRFRHARLEQ